MRYSLFQDDDSKLSFFGNYVTCNMSFEDIDRIIKYRMSPINISVIPQILTLERSCKNKNAGYYDKNKKS